MRVIAVNQIVNNFIKLQNLPSKPGADKISEAFSAKVDSVFMPALITDLVPFSVISSSEKFT